MNFKTAEAVTRLLSLSYDTTINCGVNSTFLFNQHHDLSWCSQEQINDIEPFKQFSTIFGNCSFEQGNQ